MPNTSPGASLDTSDTSDTSELAQMLQLLSGWLTADHDHLDLTDQLRRQPSPTAPAS